MDRAREGEKREFLYTHGHEMQVVFETSMFWLVYVTFAQTSCTLYDRDKSDKIYKINGECTI